MHTKCGYALYTAKYGKYRRVGLLDHIVIVCVILGKFVEKTEP